MNTEKITKLIVFTFLLASTLLFGICAEAKVINNPWILGRSNTERMQIRSIELSDTATILTVTLSGHKNNWVSINSNSYIETNGKLHRVLRAEGMRLGEHIYSTKDIKLIFGPIDQTTETIDFCEPIPGGFIIQGIDVTGRESVSLYDRDDSHGTDRQRFDKVNRLHGYEYTYISPLMIKSMSKSDLTKELKGLPLKKISSVEMVKSEYNPDAYKFETMVENAFNEPGLTNVTYRKGTDGEVVRLSVAFVDEGNTDQIKKLIFYKSGEYGQNVTLLYIKGEFTVDDLLTLIK